MVVKEFRIVMPFSLSDYKRGQRYSTARSSRQATKGADGIELVEKKSFVSDVTGKEGVYTYKIYHLDGYVPGWIKTILPASALRLEERAWDAYPHCKTVITSPFAGDKFTFIIESHHQEMDPSQPLPPPPKKATPAKTSKLGKSSNPTNASGREHELPFQENILKLDKEGLKKRELYYLDIATDEVTDTKYRLPEEDPKLVGAEKAQREPLQKGWQHSTFQAMVSQQKGGSNKGDKPVQPLMCCYKLVTVKCKIFGIAKKIENYLINTETNIFLRFHKQLFCWANDWWGLTDEQIVEYENSTFAEIGKEIGENSKNSKDQPEVTIKDLDLAKLKLVVPEDDPSSDEESSSSLSSSVSKEEASAVFFDPLGAVLEEKPGYS